MQAYHQFYSKKFDFIILSAWPLQGIFKCNASLEIYPLYCIQNKRQNPSRCSLYLPKEPFGQGTSCKANSKTEGIC